MSIQVFIDRSYGREIIRPACPKAEVFCRLAGQKTLTRQNVEWIKSLGFVVNVAHKGPVTL